MKDFVIQVGWPGFFYSGPGFTLKNGQQWPAEEFELTPSVFTWILLFSQGIWVIQGDQICLSSGSSDNFFQPKVSQVSWSGQMRDVLVQGGGMQLLSNTTLRQQRQQSKRYRFLDDLLGRKLIFNAFQLWEEIPCGKIPSLELKIFITYIFHQIVKILPDLLMWHNCHFVSEKMRHDGLPITSPTKAGH